ncbi:MAG: hypothetical protein RRB22_14930 [Gammaproteobacteria bacterium]|nr:hypothetical protein [Gammaproteobacteria bacterium]
MFTGINYKMDAACVAGALALLFASSTHAALITDPNDVRSWQGATVGTFATLYYGSDTLANRQQVVDNNMLDDGIFDPTGYTAGTLLSAGGSGGCLGTSYDVTGTGSYGYGCAYGGSVAPYADAIDNLWFQTSGVIGQTVFGSSAELVGKNHREF